LDERGRGALRQREGKIPNDDLHGEERVVRGRRASFGKNAHQWKRGVALSLR